MLAKELITNDIPPLKTSDTGLKALEWMDEFRVSHLPIVNEGKFLGLISDSDIFDMNTPEEPIGNHKLSLMRPYVFEGQHIYEVMRLIPTLNLTLVPVLDAEENYIGSISLKFLMQYVSQMAAVQEPGGIIVLELNVNDYSLTQIANIIEGNDARVLSLYITSLSDSTKMEITIKINKEDLTAILQTFQRYNYTIKASFHQSEFIEDLKNRFDSFMNYINM